MRPAADSTERFTSRAGDYAAARPGYPADIATTLIAELKLPQDAVVADIGSGTGLSCEPFLHAGLAVIGVEPNEAMRAEGDRQLAAFARFSSVAGTAEATTLPNASVDLLIAAQAFHWFDIGPARAEALQAADLASAMERSVAAGRDPALAGAITGALIGAFIGAEAIPPAMTGALARLEVIEDVAARLAAVGADRR